MKTMILFLSILCGALAGILFGTLIIRSDGFQELDQAIQQAWDERRIERSE